MTKTQAGGNHELYPLFGIVPVINTPFDDELKVDFDSLERLVRRSLTEGIGGFLVPAVASEVETLTPPERRRILEHVATVVRGQVPIVAGVSTESLKESQAFAEHALGLGCEAILCRVPLTLGDDESKIRRFFGGLAEVGMDVLMIQDLSWHGRGLATDLIIQLYDEIPAFKCLKVEIAPAGPKYTEVLEATNGTLNVSCGWGMLQMIEALDRGVHAFMTTASNRPFVEIYERYRKGRRRGAVDLFNRVLPVLSWVQQDLSVSIHFFKEYCVRRGEFRTANVRLPGPTFDPYYQRIAGELLDELLRLESELTDLPVVG